MLEASMRALRWLSARHDDDSIDRLHYFLTSNILIACSILISYKQFGGKPIECMTPKMFPHSWEDYAENYCWAQDTYIVTFQEDMPNKYSRYTEERRISYYQWVPFFLLIEAVCFRLPSLIWKYMAGHSGIKIHDIVKLAVDERNIEPNVKETNVKSLTIHLQNALKFHRRLYRRRITPHKYIRPFNIPYTSFYVTFIYLLTKLLYLANVVIQIIFMNRFLETDHYSMYGFGALLDLMNGTTWEQSRIFPRITICDFKVRAVGNIQDHSVQCVLVINIFNEKIFIFLWFWYIVLFVLTVASFVYWLYVSILPWPSRWFITQHMELSELVFDPKNSAKDVERFVSGYLKTDGVFVLRMITSHSGIIFGTELIVSLWRSFYGVEETLQRQQSALTPSTGHSNESHKPFNLDKLKLNLRNRKAKGDTSNDLSQVLITTPNLTDDRSKPTIPKKPAVAPLLPKKPTAPLDVPDNSASKAAQASPSGSKMKRVDSDLDSYISQHSV